MNDRSWWAHIIGRGRYPEIYGIARLCGLAAFLSACVIVAELVSLIGQLT